MRPWTYCKSVDPRDSIWDSLDRQGWVRFEWNRGLVHLDRFSRERWAWWFRESGHSSHFGRTDRASKSSQDLSESETWFCHLCRHTAVCRQTTLHGMSVELSTPVVVNIMEDSKDNKGIISQDNLSSSACVPWFSRHKKHRLAIKWP